MKSKTCIIISGATAVGKTAYALALAEQHQTEIISADSRQCYRELNIGVAKPPKEQLERIHHYFINSHSIHDEVNAKVFEEYALNAVEKIFHSRDVAIMVGGTGLYIRAFAGGLDNVPPVNNVIRKELNDAYSKNGLDWLQQKTREEDHVYFSKGEIENPQRMLRALEVKLSTGQSIFDFHSGKKIKRNFEIQHINLELPRQVLYERINKRVDEMMQQGLLEETKTLFPLRELNALQTVGYRELFQHIDGRISLENAVELIKKNTRHFAKRQMTWFKERY